MMLYSVRCLEKRIIMAGIGFELKKMFSKKGVFPLLRAYGYAGIVCVGPMLLGMVLLIMISLMSMYFGASHHERELLNSMVTYTLLASMVLTNTFTMVLTRFVADSLYSKEKSHILPAFWGSTSIMLVSGEILYGIFMLFAGIPAIYAVLCLILFGELVLVWNEMSFLTAVKDYQGIIKVFAGAVIISGLVGALLLKFTECEIICAMLFAVVSGYGIMSVLYYKVMVQYFPKGDVSSACFLPWIDRYPELILVGLGMSFGLFGHLAIMWGSRVNEHIQGLFYAAPVYDIPAIAAFLSILVTTINFVTSVEVNFYPKYRNFFDALNNGGILKDINQAGQEMKEVLFRELTYTFMKQLFTTIVFIIGGSIILPMLPLGMTDDMLGIFRVLCVGYAFYAVGSCLMLIQLYFADNKGALISVLAFMFTSCGGSLIVRELDIKFYGVGFWVGTVVFSIVAFAGLRIYLNKLLYHVLSSQPVIAEEKRGLFTKLAVKLEKNIRKNIKNSCERNVKRHLEGRNSFERHKDSVQHWTYLHCCGNEFVLDKRYGYREK